MTIKLKKCVSIAWSFKHDAPIEEEVPFRVYLKRNQYEKLKSLINYTKLEDKEKLEWDKIINSEAHRHLGMIGKLSGSTVETSNHFLCKMENRLHQLNIGRMDVEPQRKCINMLVNTIHSYIPLQADHSTIKLAEFDGLIADTIRRSNGITATDCKHRIFLPIEEGGLGISSALETDVTSVCRELEIVSNSTSLDSYAFRTRIASAKSTINSGEDDTLLFNHAQKAITKLGRYGIHLRDRSDGIINDILNHFSTLPKYATIGNLNYKDRCNGHSIGSGKEKNLDLAFGGPTHTCALMLQQNDWKVTEELLGKDDESEIKFADMLDVLPVIKRVKMHDFNRLFTYWEWVNSDIEPKFKVPTVNDKWVPNIPIEFSKSNLSPDVAGSITEDMLLNKTKSHMRIFGSRDVIKTTNSIGLAIQSKNKYASQINYILERKSPIIFATDGALRFLHSEQRNAASSALVMCCLDIKPKESIASGEWIHRPVIPLCSRCSLLPRKIGVEEVDIASAECHAMLMTEFTLPAFLPRIYITDSEAVRDQALQARQNVEGDINRSFIRSNIGGIGKCIMGTLARSIHESTTGKALRGAIEQNPLTADLIDIFKTRNIEFLKIAQSWTAKADLTGISFHDQTEEEMCEQDKDKYSPLSWRKDYFDNNVMRSFLKVNSHQLDGSGLKILKKPRYTTLIPNLCVLNANHLADMIADLPLTKEFTAHELGDYSIRNPISPLRFILTVNGQSLDKHVSTTLRKIFIQERVKKIKTKETQGLLWRLKKSVDITWTELNTQKGYLRSLLGLSRTHSRCIYKNTNYKQGCMLEHMETMDNDADRQRLKGMKHKELNTFLSKCTWCKSACSHDNQHGNRKHALLYCAHNNLKKFRENMRQTINEEICLMLRMIEEYTSRDNTIQFMRDISTTYLQLQVSQEGRLKKIPSSLNYAYISLGALQEKYGSADELHCIFSPENTAALELFGLVPQHTNGIDSDARIGVIDATWLGLIPKRINETVGKHRKRLEETIQHLANKSEIVERFDDKWNLIKGLTMGLAAGMHKIIGSTSKDISGRLQKKHGLDAYTITALKKKVKRTQSTMTKVQGNNKKNQLCKPCSERNSLNSECNQHTTNCSGITCVGDKSTWSIFQNFRTNKIPSGKKHCLRCTRHSSAIRAAATTLQNFIKNSTNMEKKKFEQAIQTALPTNPNYFQFMHLLQQHLPTDKQRVRTKYTNKSRISDTHKTMCRIIIQVYATESTAAHNQSDRLVHLPKKLQVILEYSEETISKRRLREKDAADKATQILEQAKIIGKDAPIVKDKDAKNRPKRKLQEVEESSEQKQREHYLKETLLERGYMSSMGIRRIIEVFRHENQNNHFFANPEASSILDG